MREGALTRLSQIRKRWFCSTFCWMLGLTDSLKQVSLLQCLWKWVISLFMKNLMAFQALICTQNQCHHDTMLMSCHSWFTALQLREDYCSVKESITEMHVEKQAKRRLRERPSCLAFDSIQSCADTDWSSQVILTSDALSSLGTIPRWP